jgi:hypothetical protein
MQRRQSSNGTWPVLGAAVAGAMLFGALAHLVKPLAAAAAPEQFSLSGPHLLRCASCGWIEAKREILPAAIDARTLQVYEYTLRMADGSVSVFQETLPTSWRLGERLMLIEASAALE